MQITRIPFIRAHTLPRDSLSTLASNKFHGSLSEEMNSATELDTLGKDDALLASLGYRAELKREFKAVEVFGLMFSVFGLLPSIASTLVYSLPAGGPVGMVFSQWSSDL
jgi:ABC-type microcin C transport system permease subunit YejB